MLVYRYVLIYYYVFGVLSLLFALMWQGMPLVAEITIQGTIHATNI